ncbi:type I-F CRISPR-associated protein Csy1 [Azomonas macrocytogenes]|uniref:CRISPR-associated protein Csy1 n=1 Tax=Azomonas macrocytogenes TaxID=69962 RepID=A0A839T0Z3_AZOMA|nr:type I-F CRISPR-associated protein Csy1 [Azomonas macrocytogenes]MBB3102788.1 CRISPR-associated protein Csy1 [Azomonas macrocytogenes]
MPDIPQDKRWERIRAAIEVFLHERLIGKLDKLAPDDPRRAGLIAQHARLAWLADAARRVRQIQAVTHTLKPIHPDARGTNLYVTPNLLPSHEEIGSHSLGTDFASDIVGNAAALDVYKLLKLKVDERSLLDDLLADDPDALTALSDDLKQAQRWREAFISLTQPRAGGLSSHTRTKQLYWLTGSDPTDNGAYLLLSPLYASSLAHAVYQTIQEDRFGEANKMARQARREHHPHERAFRDYPGLAVQKLGGTKPQNISQLNSERNGNNYLLASLPPDWKPRDVRMPWHMDSVLERIYGGREGVRDAIHELRRFLESDPPPNQATRDRVDACLDSLIDELVCLAGELQHALTPGWSRDPHCQLARAEQLWLDPRRAEQPDEETFLAEWLRQDWPAHIGQRFGNWLNRQLNGKLLVGDAEQRHWQNELLLDEAQDGWAQQLHHLRRRLDAPTYIPAREGV